MWFFSTVVFFVVFSTFAVAQNPQAADGPIVPFTSVLPACASNCGALYDVQGKCSPPNIPTVNTTCFCTNSRLAGFLVAGTAGVSNVCAGVGSCTSTVELDTIKNWYESYCAGVSMIVTSSHGLVTTTSTLFDASVLSTSSMTSNASSTAETSKAATTAKTSTTSTSTSSVASTSSPAPTVAGNGSLMGEVRIGIVMGTTIVVIWLLALL